LRASVSALMYSELSAITISMHYIKKKGNLVKGIVSYKSIPKHIKRAWQILGESYL